MDFCRPHGSQKFLLDCFARVERFCLVESPKLAWIIFLLFNAPTSFTLCSSAPACKTTRSKDCSPRQARKPRRAHRKENKRNGKGIADLRAHVELLNTTASRSSQSSAEDTRKIADRAALIDRCAACIKKRERENPHLRTDRDKWRNLHQKSLPVHVPQADLNCLVSQGESPDPQASPRTPPTPGRWSPSRAARVR